MMAQLDLFAWRPPPPPPPPPPPARAARGVDLTKKALDVRRLVLKHFGVPGVHPDDLVQEVYAEILKLNKSELSAYDPGRASFGRYVYLVGRSVTIKLAERERRQARIREEYERAYS